MLLPRDVLLATTWHCLDSWKSYLTITPKSLISGKHRIGLLLTRTTFAVSSRYLSRLVGWSQRFDHHWLALTPEAHPVLLFWYHLQRRSMRWPAAAFSLTNKRNRIGPSTKRCCTMLIPTGSNPNNRKAGKLHHPLPAWVSHTEGCRKWLRVGGFTKVWVTERDCFTSNLAANYLVKKLQWNCQARPFLQELVLCQGEKSFSSYKPSWFPVILSNYTILKTNLPAWGVILSTRTWIVRCHHRSQYSVCPRDALKSSVKGLLSEIQHRMIAAWIFSGPIDSSLRDTIMLVWYP